MREIGISPRFSRDKFVPLQTKQRYSTRDISGEVFLTLFFRGFVPFLSLADFVSRNKNLQVADLQRLKLYFGGLVTATTSTSLTFEKLQVLPQHSKTHQYFLNLKFFLKSTRPSLPLKKGLSKTHQSSLTLKGGSTAFPKPLSPQGTGDVSTALSIVFTTPSVPLVGDRNGAQTATL